MSSKMQLYRIKWLLLSLLTLTIILLGIGVYTDYTIRQKFKTIAAPTEYFSAPRKFFIGQIYTLDQFVKQFNEYHYRQREFGETITPGDFAVGNQVQCTDAIEMPEPPHQCITFRSKFSKDFYVVALSEWDQISGIFKNEDLQPVLFAETEAEVFAQYLGTNPVLQTSIELGQIPRYCLDAVLAIEDPDFLTHRGVSIRGILRAMYTNLKNVRWSQGGSTITQQLVKNYFLTPEKKLKRKIKELGISLVLEFRISKDEILNTYLNVIYLGQQGVFEVRGYGAAADFYFQKQLEELNLSECALLAAIVNSPGRYNPFSHPKRAKTRRTRVLSKMVEHGMILQEEMDAAIEEPLPKTRRQQISATAPYFVDAVKKKMAEIGFEDLAGLKVYTTLDPRAQKSAEKSVRNTIKYFEKDLASIKEIKEKQKKNLQAVLISSNPITGEITALVGGRHFGTSPYNRAIDGHRQVGSIIKPIVYLTALQNDDDTGVPYSPITTIDNSEFTYEYDGQSWSPKNYDNTYSDPVPMFYALKESMNVPTARLATSVGLEKVVETARFLGVTSKLEAFPSLSLGAFELKPIEVLQVYNTISQMGMKRPLKIVKKLVNQLGNTLYEEYDDSEQIGNPEEFAILIGMMKETLRSGTGQYSTKMGFNHTAAGKTGTTTDTKDAWFAGFTPFQVAVVWVGYDDGTSHGLTGAGGALPIWTYYMKDIAKQYVNKDFAFPEGVTPRTLDKEELQDLGVPEEKVKITELYFRADSESAEDTL